MITGDKLARQTHTPSPATYNPLTDGWASHWCVECRSLCKYISISAKSLEASFNGFCASGEPSNGMLVVCMLRCLDSGLKRPLLGKRVDSPCSCMLYRNRIRKGEPPSKISTKFKYANFVWHHTSAPLSKPSVSRVSSRVLRHARQSPRPVVVAFGGFLLHWWPPQPAVKRSSFSTVFLFGGGVVDENLVFVSKCCCFFF